jgi:Ca2+-binding RTX toxin-like protein
VDRNLLINGVSYDGTAVTKTPSILWNNGSASFAVPVTKTPASPTALTPQAVDTISVTAGGTTQTAPPNGSAVSGDTFLLTPSGTIQAALGVTATSVAFIGSSEIDLTGGSAASTVTATAGQNVFNVGSGAMTITGGVGADAYNFHSGSGSLTILDFSASKGDVLTIDSALKASMRQGSDGAGGLKLSVAGTSAVIALHGWSTLPVIHWA